MKKILSLALAVMMLVSAVPMVYAADTNPAADGTTIKLVGSQEAAGESYTVTVPAELQPGQSGTVTASGNWSSKQTLNVTAPNSVTLSYGEQTMDVGITFAGIEQVGSDTAASSATATVAVADASVLFGTWTGTLNYTVEMQGPQLITFNLTGDEYQAEEGMTWAEWIESEYYPWNNQTNGYGLIIQEDQTVAIGSPSTAYNTFQLGGVAMGGPLVLSTDVIVADGRYM